MQLSLQLSKLQGTTSYFDGNMGRVGVKPDTVFGWGTFKWILREALMKKVFSRS